MKRIFTILTACLVMMAVLALNAMPAFAAIEEGPGKGNPDVTSGGKCPPGQNKDTSPGGLKKCP